MSPDDTSRENGWKGSVMAFDWMSLIGPGAGLVDTAVNWWQNKKAMDYNKDLQKRIFEREDNSVQRKMADVQAAGLSKTLAAGGPGAGAGAAVDIGHPPQLDFGDKVRLGIELRQRRIENDFQSRNLDIAQQDANTRSIEADTHQKEMEARAELLRQQGALAEQQVSFSKTEQELLQKRLDDYPVEITAKKAAVNTELARAALYAAQTGHYDKLDAELTARIPNIQKQGLLLTQQIINAADQHDINIDLKTAQKLKNDILTAGVQGANLDVALKEAEKAIKQYEGSYMKEHGTKVPSATSWLLGFANALYTSTDSKLGWLSKDIEELVKKSKKMTDKQWEAYKEKQNQVSTDLNRLGGGGGNFWF